ncbi:MAG: hypothetical protein AAF170_00355 [Bacteroidota bacterium]
MSVDYHRLDAEADAEFFLSSPSDPISGVGFLPTNRVVRCATCGLVSLRETWEAVGGCPNGHQTPGPWTPVMVGDGASVAVASPTPAPTRAAAAPVSAPAEEKKRGWLLPLALVVAVLLIGSLFAFWYLNREAEPVVEETPVVDVPTGPTAVVVQAGAIEGELGGSDFRGTDGRYQDLYTFAADSSGRVLGFTVTSSDFYPDLMIETPDGTQVDAESLGSDGEAGSRRVAIRNLRGPGVYRILVTSRQPAVSGNYTVQITQENPVQPLPTNGRTVQAELGAFSQLVDGYYRDTYRFSGAGGREHTIVVRSSAFAPSLSLRGPSGDVQGETGRAGGSVTFTFTPAATGTHTLVVTSRDKDKKGAYTVQLSVEEPPEVVVAEDPVSTGLRAGGPPLRDSLAVGTTKAYRINGQIGDRVVVDIRTDGFTPTLFMVGPDGQRTPAEPDGDRARIRLTLPSAGAYRVVVGSQDEGEGEFSLSLEQEAAVEAAPIPRLPGGEPAQQAPAAPPPSQTGGEGSGQSPPSGNGSGGA